MLNLLKKLKYLLYLGITGYLVYLLVGSTGCSFPIKYNLGNLDPRFELSQEAALVVISSAEKIWEDAIGIDLFEYDPKGKLKINFVFDERQQLNIDVKNAEETINQSESSVEEATNQYKDLLALYNQRLDSYNISANIYEQQMQAYNEKIDYWNTQGGASTKIYKELSVERTELETMYNQLASQEMNLNELGTKVNALAKIANITVDLHNTKINIFNEKFGTAREFDQGTYLSNTINIYEFETTTDLKLVIAHEMGHALGLDHIDNPYSLMYYLMEKQDLNNIKLTEDDIQTLKQRCRIK